MPKHLIDKVCSCEYCELIDIMWGDPGLSRWERSFVLSIAHWGWHDEYTTAQKRKIKQIFSKRKRELSERS